MKKKILTTLNELSKKIEKIATPEEVAITLKQLSKETSIKESTLRAWIRSGKLPYYKPAGLILVYRSEFNQIVKGNFLTA